MPLFKTTIVGSGNWGSAIARIIGETVKKHSDVFDKTVNMWVFEELIEGVKLSEIINTKHENVKYLPGYALPPNVVAVADIVESVREADVLVFVVPHQFVAGICTQITGKTKPTATAVSLIKGISVDADGGLRLISRQINDALGIQTAALMGANLAHEVAAEHFCEATIGCRNAELKPVLKKLFHTDNFRISVVDDANTVELCGALKNIVACAAGFIDGLEMGDNTKSAVIRIGLMEMTKFVEFFYPGSNLETFFESCGIADLITTCYGGRNRKVSEAFVRNANKTLKDLEIELLGGQRLQGPHTAQLVFQTLTAHNVADQFPLFSAVHNICTGKIAAKDIIPCIRNNAAKITPSQANAIAHRHGSIVPADQCTCPASQGTSV